MDTHNSGNGPKSVLSSSTIRHRLGIKFATIVVWWSLVGGQPGYINTFAGQKNVFGDGGTATSGVIYNPQGLALSTTGDIFVGDKYYGVRKVIGTCSSSISQSV